MAKEQLQRTDRSRTILSLGIVALVLCVGSVVLPLGFVLGIPLAIAVWVKANAGLRRAHAETIEDAVLRRIVAGKTCAIFALAVGLLFLAMLLAVALVPSKP